MPPPHDHGATPRRITIFDTTLRDGEQTAGVCFSAEDKLEIARALAEMGVDVIEAGFPANSESELAAVAGVAAQVRGVRICALARAVPRDIAAAAEAVRLAEEPRIHVFVNASDMHLAHQLHRSRAQVIEMAAAMVRQARESVADVEFSPMDATRADPGFLHALCQAAVRTGARTINVPDTVGCAMPGQVAELIAGVCRAVDAWDVGVVVSFHGQDDLGLATANALAAIGAGAGQVELAVNGIGERAGNTALEEVLAALSVHGGALGVTTGVDLARIGALSALVEQRSGVPVPPNKAVVGRNAFRHASGIHQDGVLKERLTYEVLDPEAVGHTVGTQIVLGKLSGRTGFARRLQALGYRLADASLERAFLRFQALAAGRAEVGDAELHALCGEVGIALPGEEGVTARARPR